MLAAPRAGADDAVALDPGAAAAAPGEAAPTTITDPIVMGESSAISPDPTGTVLTDGFSLASSPMSMDQIDLSSGAVMGTDVSTTLSDQGDTTMALASGGGLLLDASALVASAAALESQQQQALSSNDAAAAAAQSQQTVGPGGCPSSAPPNTMRSGASDIYALCTKSVAQARTPQAAKAIKFALNHLGIPYSQPLRNDANHYDCSSFVTRAYQSAGVPIAPPGQNAPTTYTIASAPWAVHIDYSVGRAGDLVEPGAEHVVMLLADGYLVQASSTGDVTDVTRVWWQTPYLTVWIDPSKA